MITERLTSAIATLEVKNKTLEGSILADQKALRKQQMMADLLKMLHEDVQENPTHLIAMELLVDGLRTGGAL